MRETKLYLEPITLPTGARRFRVYANLNGRKYRERFSEHARALARLKELEAWKENQEAYPPLKPTPLSRTQLADAEVALEQLRKL